MFKWVEPKIKNCTTFITLNEQYSRRYTHCTHYGSDSQLFETAILYNVTKILTTLMLGIAIIKCYDK